ncbi:uncharacterized protein [Nicotiana tomentosiformis]|uniref:uncharacterized protein n=1 Tax=Nicotiana tomentosiformis TaxID=4098 RepID=UPI00388C79CA
MGSSLFWFDNWTGLGALYFLVPQDFGVDESVHNAYDVVKNGTWDVDRLTELLPEEYAAHIVEKLKPPVMQEELDVPYWMLETRGQFSVKSAWDYLRRRNEPRMEYKMIWRAGISLEGLALHQAITRYWTAQELISMMEKYTLRLKYEKVKWEFPMEGWIKINTDGASRGNPGRSAIRFCLRDKYGDVIYPAGREIDEASNIEAETLAILEALRYSSLHQHHQVWLQTDSMLLKNIVEGSWKPPWCIIDQVDEIKRLLNGCINMVSHIYREGNKLADHLANYALDVGNFECHEFWELDVQARRILNGDKLQCPYLRVKVTKN